ncbi:MAG TPA: ribosome small subunit-dependent GTPase A, partial [Cyclobacteriaceae bacterium]
WCYRKDHELLSKSIKVMNGMVMRSTGSFYDVLGDDGVKYNCRMRGKIRLEEIKETNPVAVGDRVTIELEEDFGSITEILPRTNHILRQSVKKAAHAHVLAANVDQVLLIATIKQPRTSLGFIDRFLVAAESFRIPQVLIINKKDLLSEKDLATANDLIRLYESIQVKTFLISAALDEDVNFLRSLIQNKLTLIAGHSGVGKSTLLNKLSPEIEQTTGEISGFSDKGTHTTTFAEMFQLDKATFIIDTPGIKEWGLVKMEQQEISDYFPEMRELRSECKFASSCLHINEPKCAIKDAVENGTITLSRYESYLSMVMGDDNRK